MIRAAWTISVSGDTEITSAVMMSFTLNIVPLISFEGYGTEAGRFINLDESKSLDMAMSSYQSGNKYRYMGSH